MHRVVGVDEVVVRINGIDGYSVTRARRLPGRAAGLARRNCRGSVSPGSSTCNWLNGPGPTAMVPEMAGVKDPLLNWIVMLVA